MDTLFIFGAKYLYILPIIIGAIYFLKASGETKKEIFIFAVFTLPLTFLLGVLANHLYINPRPFVVDNFAPLIPHAADNGFPSDHMLLVSVIAMLFSFFSRRTALWLWIIAFLVGISRVYVGVHHLTDIFGSVIIAVISGYTVFYAHRAILKTYKNNYRKTNE
ncbi:MAG: phosphatase PAP2 family protein [Minisyncoccota bacterium]